VPNRIRLLLDSANDLSFAVDLTPRLLSLRWQAGMAQPDDWVAAPLEGYAELDAVGLDTTGWDGLAVRVLHADQPLLTAAVDSALTVPGRGRPQVVLRLRDALSELAALPAQGLLGAALSGEWVQALVSRLPLRRRWLAGRWRLGTAAYSELGTVRLPPAAALHADAGRTRLSDDGVERSLMTLLAAAAAAEGGRLFCDEDDRIVFYDRTRLLSVDAVALSLADGFEAVTLAAPQRCTLVSVRTGSARRGAPGSVLWVNPQPQRCPARGVLRVALRWQGAQGQPIGAAQVLEPTRGADVRLGRTPATYQPADTFGAGLALLDVTSRGAALEVRNPYPYDLYLLPGSVVRGTPVEWLPQPLTIARDDRAVAVHGLRARHLELPQVEAQVEGLARFHLRASAMDWHTVTVDAARHPSVLAVRLWQRVSLSTTRPARTLDAFITSQTHEISQRGARHRVTWALCDAALWRCWRLNVSALAVDTRAAY
jgi:hypothetical protein